MRLSADEEVKLFAQREKDAKIKKFEKLAFQIARRTQHLSNREFDQILRKAKKIIREHRRQRGEL